MHEEDEGEEETTVWRRAFTANRTRVVGRGNAVMIFLETAVVWQAWTETAGG